MWQKAICKGHPMRHELTHVGLLVELANHYTTRGAYNQLKCVYVQSSVGERRLWVSLYFSCCVQHILLVLLTWLFEMGDKWLCNCCFVRCIMQHLAFSLSVSLKSKFCSHTVVLTRIPFNSIRVQISIWV